MKNFNALTLAREALRGHKGWEKQWRSPEPKKAYDVIIVGAGGHGLGTAYYLAKEHGITNIAVLEKGWLGGGNTAATPRSSAPTIFMTRALGFTTIPSSCGNAVAGTELQRHVLPARRHDAGA